MPKKRTRRPRRAAVSAAPEPTPAVVRALRREVARLTAALDAAEARHERRLAAVRRAADRRMAAVVQEIAALRHHQARAEALARILTERDGGSGTARSPVSAVSPQATIPPSR